MKKIFTLLTLLMFIGGSKTWAADVVWTFSASTIKSGADFAPTGTNTFVASDGTSELIYKANSSSGDALVEISGGHDVTVGEDVINYTSELKLNGACSSNRYIQLPSISGNGTITVVTGSSFSKKIYLSTTKDGTDITIRGTNGSSYTAYSAEASDLNGELTYYINITGGARIVSIIWSPEAAGPKINTQPSSAAYATGSSANALSVDATLSEGGGSLSYIWYKNTTKSTEGATSVATTSTFTPPTSNIGVTYYYCAVTDNNGTVNSKFATVAVADYIGKLPVTKDDPVESNSCTLGDLTLSSSATLENSSRGVYPVHFKTSGTVTVTTAGDGIIRFIKIYGTSNNTSSKSVTAGSGSTIIGNSSLMERDVVEEEKQLLSEVIIISNSPVANNNIQFTLEAESRFYVEVYGTSLKSTSVTISEYEWATFVSDKALDFTDSDVKAYVVTGHTGTAIEKNNDVKKIPANTPLLLNAFKGSYIIPVTAEPGTITTNKLKAGDGSAISQESGKTKYVLGVDGGNAQFQKIVSTPATVPVGKAYLEFNEVIESRTLGFDDEVTGIKNIKVGTEDNVYYDLNGRRVLYPTKGLYIVNGKKVVMK